jgi:hypothetical protein
VGWKPIFQLPYSFVAEMEEHLVTIPGISNWSSNDRFTDHLFNWTFQECDFCMKNVPELPRWLISCAGTTPTEVIESFRILFEAGGRGVQ